MRAKYGIRPIFTLCLYILACFLVVDLSAADTPALTVVHAGVENAEDAPFVPASYAFAPGDFVYFVFEVSGYKTSGGQYETQHQLELSFDVQMLDDSGVRMTDPSSGKIAGDVSPEDKNWLPKRRASFLIPSYVAAGTYHIHVTVEDLLAKTKTDSDFPFKIAGPHLQPTQTLSIQNFRFLRGEQDGPPLEMADYRPGSSIWARFEITGFKLGPKNAVDVRYGVTVLRPNGNTLFSQPDAAAEKSEAFYPPHFIPGNLSINTTPDLSHGQYTVVVTVQDLIGKQNHDFRYSFEIE